MSERRLPRNTLEAIEILRGFGLHEILFRNAGVGFMFYEGPWEGAEENQRPAKNWRKHLKVHGYYDTLDEAALAEYNRLVPARAMHLEDSA